MRVFILANGEPPSAGFLAQAVASHDLFLATDGAALTAARLDVRPDVVSGDFDSLELDAAKLALPDAEFLATPDQNRTDLEKAVEIARERGADFLTIAGAAGRRIDHTLGNLALLLRWRAEHPALPIVFVSDGAETLAVRGEMVLETAPGDAVSLLSFDGLARVSLGGVRWPLDNHPLAVGAGGLLNEALGKRVTLRVEGGIAVVCRLDAALRRQPPG